MILPWLLGFQSLIRAPVVWSLFFANLAFYGFTSSSYKSGDASIEELIADSEFLSTQSLVFSQFVERHPAEYSPLINRISEKSKRGSLLARRVLSGLALRDLKFISSGLKIEYSGDAIAIDRWKKKFTDLCRLQKNHPLQEYGIGVGSTVMWKFFTYQFVHGGSFHIIINMFFLLIFGGFVEAVFGHLCFLAVYLLGGVVAALSFMFATGLSMAPLIGASGAINALVGFCAVFFLGKRMQFLYFLLPSYKYYGKTDLPFWIFLLLWVFADVGSAITSVPELGGVAYTAHLGGVGFGVLTGLLLLFWSKSTSHRIFRDASGLHELK